jgi:uncharacterized protein
MFFAKRGAHDAEFFSHYSDHGTHIAEGARAFRAMLQQYEDPTARATMARAVSDAEYAADKITANVHRLLRDAARGRTATPIERDRALRLIDAMDDVLDLLQESTELLSLYDVQHIPSEVLRLGDISVRCCERVQHVLTLLPQLKESEAAEAALKSCEEIDQLESDADRVMRGAMSALFREEPDTRQLIKLKAVYEHLESISDLCEDVAQIVEGIVLDNALGAG